MTFLRTVPVAEATGEVQALYEKSQDPSGFVPNYVKIFSLRPEMLGTYVEFSSTIRARMDDRRYELVTTSAALAAQGSYCSLAHGKILRDQHLGAAQTEVFARNYADADLTPAEKAMIAYVRKIAAQATSVTQADIDELHRHGFDDREILDIALATAARVFFSKFLDAVGVVPDHLYTEVLEPGLRQALVVGRDIEPAAPTPAPAP